MKKKDIIWCAVLGTLFLLCCFLWISWGNEQGCYAVVRQDERELYRLPLAVTKEVTIECDKGFNTLNISPEGIKITKADCPDQLCQKQGLVSKTDIPIVCLPHRLVITIEGGGHEN